MKRRLLILVVIPLLFSVLYFVRSDRPNVTDGYDLWQGMWESNKTDMQGNFKVFLQQSGAVLSGDISISGSPLTKGGKISGSINGDKIEFGLLKDKRGVLKYYGTISKNTMSGTWEIPALGDHGIWQAKK